MDETKVTLVIENLRVVYESRWLGTADAGRVPYEYFELGSHEIECKYMPKELHAAIEEFVKKVEVAHDKAPGGG